MRCIGRLEDELRAHRFRDYLLTQGIESRVDAEEGGEYAVWVYGEDEVPRAKEQLGEFRKDPHAARYRDVVREANERRARKLELELEARKRNINLRQKWNAPLIRRLPVTLILIVLSGMVSAYTGFGENRARTNALQTAAVSEDGTYYRDLVEVRRGQIWRLFSPMFIHLNAFHLLGNMYWLYLFGGLLETTRGHGRLLAIVLFIALFSNVAQHYAAGPNFGGMSGVVYGLFGYLWFKTNFSPEEGYALPPSLTLFFVLWMILCATGYVGNVANTAHVSGLVIGVIIAALGKLSRKQLA